MELKTKKDTYFEIGVTEDELLIINSALNEICHGIDVYEFETRIGASREEVEKLFKEIHSLIYNEVSQ